MKRFEKVWGGVNPQTQDFFFFDVVPVRLPVVLQATEDASRMIMGQLTASGVKLVLPALLKGLEDKVWRGAQLLASMNSTPNPTPTRPQPAPLRASPTQVWRTKQGSVQLLGSMAHCAPKQLGTCLPAIVPRQVPPS